MNRAINKLVAIGLTIACIFLVGIDLIFGTMIKDEVEKIPIHKQSAALAKYCQQDVTTKYEGQLSNLTTEDIKSDLQKHTATSILPLLLSRLYRLQAFPALLF